MVLRVTSWREFFRLPAAQPLKREPQAELNLPWVGRTGRLAEARRRHRSLPKSRVRELQIRPIEEIEPFHDHLQTHVLRDANAPAQPQVERSEIKPYAGVAPDAERPVVGACVVIAVASGLNI